MPATRQELVADLAACADPARAELGLARLVETVPSAGERLRASPALARTVVTVMAASPFLTRTCVTDPMALDVLGHLDRPLAPLAPLSRWKALELLRIAARDLSGEVPLEAVGRDLAELADGVLRTATQQTGVSGEMAVVAMGKLGARELNYGSDIDIMLVGEGDPHPMLAAARQAWRTDLDLRPEGRAGVLVRSLASYQAYWDRWAQTWEFQALLKARPAAGDPELGSAFSAEAAKRVWGRPLGADDLRSLRAMKARAEEAVARHGLTQREIKLGRGGIRDIEFAVQLLQLVHGREDEALRAPATLARPGGVGRRGVRRPLRRRRAGLRLPVPAGRGAPPAAFRGPPGPRRPGQRTFKGSPGPRARLPGRPQRQRPGPLRRRLGPSPGHGPDDPRAPLFPASVGGLQRPTGDHGGARGGHCAWAGWARAEWARAE